MDLKLQDKVIIISGGAKGIGEGIANALAAEGAIPVIIGRNKDDNNKVVNAINYKCGMAFEVTAELTRPDDCKNAIDIIAAEFSRIDGLVNNAGVNDSVNLENGSYENFMASLHRNLVHYYLLAHHALPHLKKSKGHIVNIGS